MTMIKGERGPLYSIDGPPSYLGGSGRTVQNSGIIPATQADLEAMTFEVDMDPSRFIDRRIHRKGGHSIVYRAFDEKSKKTVALKRHLHYVPLLEEVGDPKEIRAAEDRFKSEAQALSKLGQGHPGIVKAYGCYIVEEEGETVPYLVMELLEGNHLEHDIKWGQGFSEEDVRKTILSVGSILDYLHTGNGRQLIYRDMKARNVFPMSMDSLWPHKVIDFSETKIGDATLMSGSVLGTPGYNAPEASAGVANSGTDRYSLGRIALAMKLQNEEKFKDSWIGTLSLDELRESGDLDVSDELFRVISRTTEKDPESRYQNFLEMVNDLGYNIDRVPQTRAELEAILGGRSLPVLIQERETGEVAEAGEGDISSKYSIEDNGDGTFAVVDNKTHTILGLRGDVAILKGKDVYGTIKNIRDRLDGRKIVGERNSYELKKGYKRKGAEEEITNSIQAYIKHAAQEHPILQPVARGEKTLERLYKKVKAGKPGFLYLMANILNFDFLDVKKLLSERKQAREAYEQKVGELEKVVSGCELTLGKSWKSFIPGYYTFSSLTKENRAAPLLSGFGSGVVYANAVKEILKALGAPFTLSSYLTYIGALVGTWVAMVVPSLYTGDAIGKAIHRRTLKKKFGEMDSFLEPPKSSKDLEKRVEDVSLTHEENPNIDARAVISGVVGGSAIGIPTSILLGPELGSGFVSLATAAGFFGGVLGNYYPLLKRKVLGLPAKVEKPEMQEFARWSIPEKEFKRFKNKLEEFGYMKTRFRRKFDGGSRGEVRYKIMREIDFDPDPMGVYMGIKKTGIKLTLNAVDEVTVRPLYDLMDEICVSLGGTRISTHPKIKPTLD